jgi:hypothetical protein
MRYAHSAMLASPHLNMTPNLRPSAPEVVPLRRVAKRVAYGWAEVCQEPFALTLGKLPLHLGFRTRRLKSDASQQLTRHTSIKQQQDRQRDRS